MLDTVQKIQSTVAADGACGLQAKLYREIGISAVAAALQSINLPEPGQRRDAPATRARSTSDRTFRAV